MKTKQTLTGLSRRFEAFSCSLVKKSRPWLFLTRALQSVGLYKFPQSVGASKSDESDFGRPSMASKSSFSHLRCEKCGLILTLSLLLLSTSLVGCAPSFKDTLIVDAIPEPDPTTQSSSLSGAKLKVDTFTDLRADPIVAEINGRTLTPEGDPGVAVQRGFESYLKGQGATVLLFGAESGITGSITEWKIAVKPGFPVSFIEGKAAIKVDVSDSTGRIVYKGQYSGSSSMQHPFPKESTAESVLGDAMAQAITEALKDSRLVRFLRG